MDKDKDGDDKKNITDGESVFTENELFKKKENLYLVKVFGLSVIIFILGSLVFTNGNAGGSYFLSLISSVLIINGYNEVKNENNYKSKSQ